MEIDKRVETLETEFKLIKGELKQTIASVRDYLSDFKLPPAEEVALLAEMGGEEEQSSLRGDLALHSSTGSISVVEDSPHTVADPSNSSAGATDYRTIPSSSNTISPSSGTVSPSFSIGIPRSTQAAEILSEEAIPHPVGQNTPFTPKTELPESHMEHGESAEARDEEFQEKDEGEKLMEEISQSVPRVNLLANLVRWVSKAKKQLGDEQFPTFLEVYGISGHLSPELKEVILHLVDITEQQAADDNKADIWSQLILELHGILTGGDAPLHTVKPLWQDNDDEAQQADEAQAEEEIPKDKPIKLKLVFSNGDGKDKEFSINLSPAENKNETSGHLSEIIKDQLKD